MDKRTQASEIIESFESTFADKQVIPFSLELMWLKKAIGRYSVELDPLNFDEEILEFDTKLDRYIIDTLAQFIMMVLITNREIRYLFPVISRFRQLMRLLRRKNPLRDSTRISQRKLFVRLTHLSMILE